MNYPVNPWLVGLAVLAVIGLMATLRAGKHKTKVHSREVTRMTGNTVRVLMTTLVLVGVQWVVLANSDHWQAWAVALGLPAFFAAAGLVRLLSVTTEIHPVRSKGHRR